MWQMAADTTRTFLLRVCKSDVVAPIRYDLSCAPTKSISVQTGWNSSILERLLSIEGTTMYQVILGSMKTVIERSNNSYARIISAAYDFGW